MPVTKVGTEMPISETTCSMLLDKPRGFSAVYTPIGTPIARANTAAAATSSSVAGRRSAIRSETGRLLRYEIPKSPPTAPRTKRWNWAGIGASRPSCARNARRSSVVAFSGSMLFTGSPTNRNMANAISATASITRTACNKRLTTKASMLILSRRAIHRAPRRLPIHRTRQPKRFVPLIDGGSRREDTGVRGRHDRATGDAARENSPVSVLFRFSHGPIHVSSPRSPGRSCRARGDDP